MWCDRALNAALGVCGAALLGVALSVAAAEGEPTALELRVKAAFVYKFAEYVEWPAGAFAQPDAPLTIGVMGADALADELRDVTAGRRVDGHPVAVRVVKAGESLSGLQVLFIGRTETMRLAQWIKLASPSALIVSESDGALDAGSVINLVMRQGRVRFEVSLGAADKRGLKLSSRMLAVALQVRSLD